MAISRQNLAAHVVTAAGASLLVQPALAQTDNIGFRGEAFAGVAREELPLNQRDTDFSGGAMPSIIFGTNSPVVAQIDGLIADHLGGTVLAGAGHVGVRAGEAFTIGIYTSYAHFDRAVNLESYRIGGEARYFSGPFSISGVAGYEHVDRGDWIIGPAPDFDPIARYRKRGSFFSMVDLSAYASDNWAVTAGHRYVGRRHAVSLGTEAGFGGSGLSLFAEGRIGDAGYTAAWAGLRVKLGGSSATLREREESGFTNRLKDELFGPNRLVVAPPPPPPNPPDEGGGSCCGPCYPQ